MLEPFSGDLLPQYEEFRGDPRPGDLSFGCEKTNLLVFGPLGDVDPLFDRNEFFSMNELILASF